MTNANDAGDGAHGATAEQESEGSRHIVSAFDRRMRNLESMTCELGLQTTGRLRRGVPLLAEGDLELVKRFVLEDEAINALSHEINDLTVETIARWQPVAEDLRWLVSLLRITRDLERVADCAVSLAKRAKRLARPLSPPLLKALGEMAEDAASFLQAVMGDYCEGGEKAIAHAAELDDALDLRYSALARLIVVENEAGRLAAGDALKWFSAVKLLERAGDHIAHIANSVHYGRHGHYPQEEDED